MTFTDHSGRRLILLGPQPKYQTLSTAWLRLPLDGPVALVTAGWKEDELDADRLRPLSDVLPAASFNLELFRRSEELFADDPELIQLLRQRQDKLRHLRTVYCTRLDDLGDAARKTLARNDTLLDLTPECESAVEMVRQLDRQYFLRTSQICDEYDQKLDLPRRTAVMRRREEIVNLMGDARAIVISGGHVAIILNRLRLFDVLDVAPELPVVAWAGGAMALADQVVLFHDSPPQGRGNAEVMRAGMSMYDTYLPLPDAANRLLLDDAFRVQLFCRRFNYYQCVVFDEHTIMDRCDGSWWISAQTRRLNTDGQLVGLNGEVSA